MESQSIIIRDVAPADVKDICRIYNYYIEHTYITFETELLSEAEMSARIEGLLYDGFPYYVLELNGKIAGYTYLHNWHVRAAYSHTKETTIYLDKDVKGKGLGLMLYQYLLERIDPEEVHTLIAGISIPNDPSVKLHEKLGFTKISHMKEVGRKFDQWWDVGHWQLILPKGV